MPRGIANKGKEPGTQHQDNDETLSKAAGKSCTAEDVNNIIQERMSEVFAEKFEHLKDRIVTIMASKLSGILEENKNLKNEIEQLRESISQLNEVLEQEINQVKEERERERQKKRL